MRKRVLIGLSLKALDSFDRLVVDARDKRSECTHHLKTMAEMVIYSSWVREDESDERARRIYGKACQELALYGDICATVDHEHEHDTLAGSFRWLRDEAFCGIANPDPPRIPSIAREAKVYKHYYPTYRATCQAAHLGDLQIYMPPAVESLEASLRSFALSAYSWSIQVGINLACDVLHDASNILGMDMAQLIDGFRKRRDEIRTDEGTTTKTPADL